MNDRMETPDPPPTAPDDGAAEDHLAAMSGAETARVTRIERNADGQLVAHLAGRDEPAVDVRLARYFPWSLPERYISVLAKEGQELAMLRTLDELDPASRDIAEAELSEKIFNPKIRRVINYKREFGISSMVAETDRGEVIFQFRGRHDVRILSATRALFTDVDGNTYELADLSALDPASQKQLQMFF